MTCLTSRTFTQNIFFSKHSITCFQDDVISAQVSFSFKIRDWTNLSKILSALELADNILATSQTLDHSFFILLSHMIFSFILTKRSWRQNIQEFFTWSAPPLLYSWSGSSIGCSTPSYSWSTSLIGSSHLSRFRF